MEQHKNVVDQQQNMVEQQVGNGIGLQDVYALGRMISDLEIIFQQLKERKEMREKEGKQGRELSIEPVGVKWKEVVYDYGVCMFLLCFIIRCIEWL